VRVGEVLCLRPLPVEDAKGNLIQVDTNRLLQPGQLEEVAVSVVETATFVEFAAKMDDGEARSAAVAAHRGFWLATDDRVSLRGAREYIPPIPTITTPEWIKYWAEQASVDRQALAETLRRIEICATYRPRREHQLRAWWDYHRMHN
jgi:hypothetical protein